MPPITAERFVGRERELSRLAVALEAASGGSSRRLLVDGVGGVGVSRLLDETIRRVGRLAEPFLVVRCRAVAGRAFEPYRPLIDGLRPFLDSLVAPDLERVLGSGAETMAALLPELGARLALGDRPVRYAVGPERRVARTAEAVLGLLERAGESRPVLLILEDLHLADASTRAVAAFLSRVARPARLCVVITYGSDAVGRGHPFHADLAAISDAPEPPDRLSLEPLVRDELAGLIGGIEGERPTASLVLLVAERSGGNPLLAEEVLAARRELSGVSLGSSLDELVAARLARRTPEARRVLRLLAPADQPLSAVQLAAAADAFERGAGTELMPRSTGRPRRGDGALDADLRAGLDESIATGFVVERPDGSHEIRHELIARAIVADLLPSLRRRHHLALADALSDAAGSAARQWIAVGETSRGRAAMARAADVAEALDAPADALAALELSMELGAGDADDRDASAVLLTRAADLALAAGRPERALAYLEAAATRLREASDRSVVAALHERLGRVARSLGDHDRALREHRRAADLVGRAPSLLRARILGSLAQTLMLLGHFAEADRVATEAIAVARALGPAGRAAEGHATCTLGIARVWGAEPEVGVELLLTARTIAREVGDADDLFRSILNLSTALTLLHRGEEAIEVTREGIEEARRQGVEAAYGSALRGNVTEALFVNGRWQEAREMIGSALQWTPAADVFADAAVTAGVLEVESASDERAARLLGRRLLELRTAPDPQSVVHASRAVAAFALWRNDAADASRAAEMGWSTIRQSEDWMLTARMAATYLEVQAAVVADAHERRALHHVGAARERAQRVLAQAEVTVRESGVPAGAASRAEAEAYLAIARAFAARLDGRDDPTIWDDLARRWESVGDPYQVARARWRQAEAELPRRDAREGRAAARVPLLEAARIARELGAAPLLHALQELARRALIPLPDAEAGVATPADADAGAGAGRDGDLVGVLARSVPVGHAADPTASGTASHGATASPVGAGNGHGGIPEGPSSSGAIPSGAISSGEPLAAPTGRGRARRGSATVPEPVTAGSLAAAFVGSREGTHGEAGFGLSAREREVLGLIVQGRTNREIGEHLFISQKTVGVHVGNILAKLGVSGRVEAAMVAVRLDLVPNRAR